MTTFSNILPGIKKGRVYVAGPMRGKPNLNRAEFQRIANLIAKAGHHPVSPHDLDDVFGIENDFTESDLRNIIIRDLLAIAYGCDAIVLLDGWQLSAGANVEFSLGLFLGLPMYAQDGELLAVGGITE